MSERDFEEGRYLAIKGLKQEFEELFGKEPGGYEAKVFYGTLRGELFSAECRLLMMEEQEGE